jgi:hypothetical protein
MWDAPYVIFFGGCILLLILGYFVAGFIIGMPILCLWCWLLPKMTNWMGRHTTNRFNRELAYAWIIAGLPFPFIPIALLISPKAMWILFGLDLLVWLLFAVYFTIIGWKEPLKPWDDY